MIKIKYIVEDDAWRKISPNIKHLSRKIAICALKHMMIDDDVSFTILFTNNIKMQQLNRDFRKKDEATNVLSFADSVVLNDGRYLGDIALGYKKIDDEALKQNKSFKNHYTHLIVHGILHLLGYDHMNEKEADIMENLEIAILDKLKVPNPYFLDEMVCQ